MIIKTSIFFVLFVTSLSFFSCSLSTTKTIEPKFAMGLDSVSKDINTIVYTPEASINGKEINVNGKSSTELDVNLINSRNLPSQPDEQNKIGQQIATLLKHALKEHEAFTDYKIIFTKKTIDNAVTKSNYTSYSYKSSDLKDYLQVASLGDKFDPTTYQATGKTQFTENDPQIVSVLKYYNSNPGAPIVFKLYKQTDSGMQLLMKNENGIIESGNRHIVNTLKTADFYKVNELKAGTYKLEYLVGDTSVGGNYFTLF